MSPAYSTQMAPGTRAPDFELTDAVSKRRMALTQLRGERATVVMFICNHCPYVKHVQHELVRLAHDYTSRGVAFVAINANDARSYPADSPECMREVALDTGYPFPYLYDETQQVARAYGAACTPEFFVFDAQLGCVYHGRLDDATPKRDVAVTGRDLRAALDALLGGRDVSADQAPAMGCSIKWR